MRVRPPTRGRRRALGQHFLVDSTVAERMLTFAALEPGTSVLEIGPGRGALTGALLRAGQRVVAVEYDGLLARALLERADPRLEVVAADFLRLDLTTLPAPLPVVANLPYSSATAILARLLEHAERFPRIVVMVQREVAERLAAVPGSRDYGSLTVLTKLYARVTLGFHVPAAAFAPPPRVESSVVRLDVEAEPRIALGDPARFRRVVRFAFAQRRKTLRNALGAGLGDLRHAERALDRAGIDPMRRAESCSLEDFARLADAVEETRVAGVVGTLEHA